MPADLIPSLDVALCVLSGLLLVAICYTLDRLSD